MMINVLFFVHLQELFEEYSHLYKYMVQIDGFYPVIITMNHTIHEYLENIQIPCVHYMNNDHLINIKEYNPDYVFFDTPYEIHFTPFRFEDIAKISKICFVSYGALVWDIKYVGCVWNDHFFSKATHVFLENDILVEYFKKTRTSGHLNLHAAGSTKLTELRKKTQINNKEKHIMYTPRWCTNEGVRTFSKYCDFFIKYFAKKNDVKFICRYHPLTNYSTDHFNNQIARINNMNLDNNVLCNDTFNTTDILITDTSSLIYDFFCTGRPIIYLHERDVLNDMGKILSEGMYIVKNETELECVLDKLSDNHDPLKNTREKIIEKYYNPYDALEIITKTLSDDR